MTCTGCLPTTGWNWKCYFWSTVLNGLASAYLKDSLLSFLCAGQHRDTARVFPMEVWVYGEGREERGTWVRKGEKVLTVFLFVGKKKKFFLMWNSPWGYALRTVFLLESLKRVWFLICDCLMNTLTVPEKFQSLTSWMVKWFWGFLYPLASLLEFP